MRGVIAAVVALLPVAVTAVVVAAGGHRTPSPVAIPLTAPGPAAPPAADPPPPSTVHLDEGSGAVTVRAGTLLDVRLHGSPADRWRDPDTTTPRILVRLSSSSTPDGDARGTFRAAVAGQGFVVVVRSTSCSPGPTGGVCPAEARRITVTVTGWSDRSRGADGRVPTIAPRCRRATARASTG